MVSPGCQKSQSFLTCPYAVYYYGHEMAVWAGFWWLRLSTLIRKAVVTFALAGTYGGLVDETVSLLR